MAKNYKNTQILKGLKRALALTQEEIAENQKNEKNFENLRIVENSFEQAIRQIEEK